MGEILRSDVEKLTRAFIAIEFSDEVIKEVARVQGALSKWLFTGKMTALENLHLTLKFLGEIDSEKIEKVKEKLKFIEFKSFEGKLGIAGTFSTRGNPRIVWIKINGREAWGLQNQIDEKLKDLFKPEERFMSHMTIARVKYVKDKKGFINYAKNIKVKEIKFKVESFKLKSSELRNNGPQYEDIREYKSTN